MPLRSLCLGKNQCISFSIYCSQKSKDSPQNNDYGHCMLLNDSVIAIDASVLRDTWFHLIIFENLLRLWYVLFLLIHCLWYNSIDHSTILNRSLNILHESYMQQWNNILCHKYQNWYTIYDIIALITNFRMSIFTIDQNYHSTYILSTIISN